MEAWPDAKGVGFWVGSESKAALDEAGSAPIAADLSLPASSVPVYYGPNLFDLESLPREESLQTRVLSVHAIAVAWITLDRFGERNSYSRSPPPTRPFTCAGRARRSATSGACSARNPRPSSTSTRCTETTPRPPSGPKLSRSTTSTPCSATTPTRSPAPRPEPAAANLRACQRSLLSRGATATPGAPRALGGLGGARSPPCPQANRLAGDRARSRNGGRLTAASPAARAARR